MSVGSKLARWPLNRLHCSQYFVHPNMSCVEFLLYNVYRNTISNGKYFLPILVTPIVLKLKHLDKATLKDIIKKYVKTVFYSSICSSLVFFIACILRSTLGRYYHMTTFFIPSFMGTQLFWLFPKELQSIFVTATSQASLETLFNQYQNTFTHFILKSTTFQTIVFMLNSAIILHYQRLQQFKGFWFIQAEPKPHIVNKINKNTNNKYNNHNNESYNDAVCLPLSSNSDITYMKYILNSIGKYLIFGMSLDLINTAFKSNVITKQNTNLFHMVLMKMKAFQFNMTPFFLSYIGIYKATFYVLNGYTNIKSETCRHFISCCFSGLSYLTIRRLSLFTFSTIIATQILWQQFCENKSNTTSTKAFQWMKTIPFAGILTPLNMAYLSNCFYYRNNDISSLGKAILQAITDGKTGRLYDLASKNEIDIIMEIAKRNKSKGFF